MGKFRQFRLGLSHSGYSCSLVVLVLLVGCRSDVETLEPVKVHNLIPPAVAQLLEERKWLDASLRELHRLPLDSSVTIFMPGTIRVGADGSLFYFDLGDKIIKQFDLNGQFIRSFGGPGKGPGEFNLVTDFGLIGDTILYASDPYQRKVTFFSIERAAYLRSVSGIPGYRYRLTKEGRAYWSGEFQDSLFSTSMDGQNVRRFGTLIHDQRRNSIVLGGRIHAYNEHLLYIPTRYPAIFQWDSTGTLVYARTTPDFGRGSAPEVERTADRMIARPIGRALNSTSAVFGDELVVLVPTFDTTDAFDVYDSLSGDYQHSLLAPVGRTYFALYDPGRQRVWQVMDTTTVVYAVDRP